MRALRVHELTPPPALPRATRKNSRGLVVHGEVGRDLHRGRIRRGVLDLLPLEEIFYYIAVLIIIVGEMVVLEVSTAPSSYIGFTDFNIL